MIIFKGEIKIEIEIERNHKLGKNTIFWFFLNSALHLRVLFDNLFFIDLSILLGESVSAGALLLQVLHHEVRRVHHAVHAVLEENEFFKTQV